jgi:predicted metal-dependent phosphoesterase TrpH
MNAETRVDLHAHSSLSDGAFTPEALADRMHASGVAIASLTDHDRLDGLTAFQERLERHGVGFIPGVEISARHLGREVHLLGFGFRPGDPALTGALHALRQSRRPALQNLQQSAQQGARYLDWETGDKEGDLPAQTAIDLLHGAGGKAFLAHPRVLGSDLDGLCRELKAIGLDGLEAYYGPYSTDERESLAQLADRHGLLVSGGTDWHGDEGQGPGIEMPHDRWRAFLEAVCFQSPPQGERSMTAPAPATPAARGRWLRFGARFVLPSLLALGLFIAAFFAVLLPMFEGTLMERKRELIRELARSAVSIAADREREVREGRLGDRQARDQAKARIGALRYGREGKDYFWIQDLGPRMVMHPWRPDLDGHDLSEFKDARGQRLFVAFADLVREKGEGYAPLRLAMERRPEAPGAEGILRARVRALGLGDRHGHVHRRRARRDPAPGARHPRAEHRHRAPRGGLSRLAGVAEPSPRARTHPIGRSAARIP